MLFKQKRCKYNCAISHINFQGNQCKGGKLNLEIYTYIFLYQWVGQIGIGMLNTNYLI